MSDTVIRVENLSKLYRLGEVGTGSLAHDVNRWWHRVRGKEDPGTVRKREFKEMPWCNQGAGLRQETASTAGDHRAEWGLASFRWLLRVKSNAFRTRKCLLISLPVTRHSLRNCAAMLRCWRSARGFIRS